MSDATEHRWTLQSRTGWLYGDVTYTRSALITKTTEKCDGPLWGHLTREQKWRKLRRMGVIAVRVELVRVSD